MSLPDLPSNTSTIPNDTTKERFHGPTRTSNWLIPGMVCMGAYPGSRDETEHRHVISAILKAGITTFCCLQSEVLPESERDVMIQHFTPYEDIAREFKKTVKFVRFPIDDGFIGDDNDVYDFVNELVERLANKEVLYIHCWGGHGRTGTIACLLYGKLYGIGGDEAINIVSSLHDCRMDARGSCPETEVQFEQVRRLLVPGMLL